jgi:hypothetical protein
MPELWAIGEVALFLSLNRFSRLHQNGAFAIFEMVSLCSYISNVVLNGSLFSTLLKELPAPMEAGGCVLPLVLRPMSSHICLLPANGSTSPTVGTRSCFLAAGSQSLIFSNVSFSGQTFQKVEIDPCQMYWFQNSQCITINVSSPNWQAWSLIFGAGSWSSNCISRCNETVFPESSSCA